MKVDTSGGGRLAEVPAVAAAAEADGFDGVWFGETAHDPFLSCLKALDATERIDVGTSIAIAFARSPMTLASTAWDLNEHGRGRFILGLGSQIKPHIEKRFSMPWSHPAPRMREFVLALRAIWDCWQNGTKLDFRGEFYKHTLMTPYFMPTPNEVGGPRVFIAGVGEIMTEVAGEVADGFFCHAFTTERYAREVTLPALKRGREKAGQTMDGFDVCAMSFIVTGANEKTFERARIGVCEQIAFYGSTPAYRGVLELHGWGDLQTELNKLSKQGRWADMGRLIDDDVLRAFAVVGAPDEIAPKLAQRFAGVATRLSFYGRGLEGMTSFADAVAVLRAA